MLVLVVLSVSLCWGCVDGIVSVLKLGVVSFVVSVIVSVSSCLCRWVGCAVVVSVPSCRWGGVVIVVVLSSWLLSRGCRHVSISVLLVSSCQVHAVGVASVLCRCQPVGVILALSMSASSCLYRRVGVVVV